MKYIYIMSIAVFASSYSITIRYARTSDYAAICALDRQVTYEYFKPLYQEYYAHLELGKNPDPFLEIELAADEHDFKELLAGKNDRMFIALDDEKIVGMILFHDEIRFLILIFCSLIKSIGSRALVKNWCTQCLPRAMP